MRLLAWILRLKYSFVSRLEFYNSLRSSQTNLLTVVNERQRSLAISLKCGDFSHRPNLLNERNLPFLNAKSTALKTGMVPNSLASAEKNPPISFSFSWLWANRRRKMAVCQEKYRPSSTFLSLLQPAATHLLGILRSKTLGLTVVDLVVDCNQTLSFSFLRHSIY